MFSKFGQHVASRWSMGRSFVLCLFVVLTPATGHAEPMASMPIEVGFSRRDITPQQPLRLSGYASRTQPHTAVRDRLFSRVLVLGTGKQRCVIVSVESLAVTAEQTQVITSALASKHGLDRSRVVLCSTHSHTAPHPAGVIDNLFRVPLSDQESDALRRYSERLIQEVLAGVEEAIAKQTLARLYCGDAESDFAVNRRVLKDGLWSGFGVQPDGPTDRRVRVLVAKDDQGAVLGGTFLYACHCTTLGPDFNEVSGDWAGLAADQLETDFTDAIFLPIIGCGADANPEPRNGYDFAVQHGQKMAAAVALVVGRDDSDLRAITTLPTARFGYAGISSELPSKATLQEAQQGADINTQRWATRMLEIWEEKGRLPESYPAPIHTWTFGDDLLWVFLGGEVVVDYQARLESEFRQAKNVISEVWVGAYTDDCFGYVASERMRLEGGYEVDYSMIFYGQPGRWQSGTEDLIVRRVREIQQSEFAEALPQSPAQSLRQMIAPDGVQISLVAHEPLIADPINLAFGSDGSVWVVEMGDYPLGSATGGSVKRLTDRSGDGILDHADAFLTGLSYPTSVFPWRDGVLVIVAPDVIFARDTTGDGVADQRETLLSGIGKANPQHRASGFQWGLDGWVYFGSGDHTKDLISHRTGQTVGVAGGDVRWQPDTGQLEKVPGHTQFLRSRDRWGRWFGNNNSVPIYHYLIDNVAIHGRNRDLEATRLVLDPGVAPPVFPSSRVVDRFNDLFAKQRFTSACGTIITTGNAWGAELLDVALVCEPVHNLVARFRLTDSGATVRGQRPREDLDRQLDWLTSHDTWFRPTRCIEAPDGSIWVVDMYRHVIEHPQWIPDAWQAQVDLRGGSDYGRIYRVAPQGHRPDPPGAWRLDAMADSDLVQQLLSPMGMVRDLAMQQILWRQQGSEQSGTQIAAEIRAAGNDLSEADIRLTAAATLWCLGEMQETDWQNLLTDPHPHVQAWGVTVARRSLRADRGSLSPDLVLEAIGQTSLQHITGTPRLGFEALLTLGELELSATERTQMEHLLQIWLKATDFADWLLEACSLAMPPQAEVFLPLLVSAMDQVAGDSVTETRWNQWEASLSALWRQIGSDAKLQLLSRYLQDPTGGTSHLSTGQLLIVLIASRDSTDEPRLRDAMQSVVGHARPLMHDPQQATAVRVRAARLLGNRLIDSQQHLRDLRLLLQPQQPGAVRESALAAAYRIAQPETADVLLESWKQLLPSERAVAGATLVQRRDWLRKLVAALTSQQLRLDEIDPATISALKNCRDYGIMKTVGTLLIEPTVSQRQELLREYQAAVQSHLRSLRQQRSRELAGANLLYQTHCAVCHEPVQVVGQAPQPALGPALRNLGQWSTGQWVSAILDPSAVVEPAYRQYRLLTDSGQTFTGLIVDQSDETITLGLADSRRITIPRAELELLEDAGVSLMPEGFESKLSPEQIAEIIVYLTTD